jgi:hypothetical protein
MALDPHFDSPSSFHDFSVVGRSNALFQAPISF